MELGKPCSSPTLSYEDNVASVHVVQTNKPSPRLRHIDISLSYLHQEFDMTPIEPVHAPARHMLVDFLTKHKSGQSILHESSCLMGHVHLLSLPPEHFKNLSSIAPISTLSSLLSADKLLSSKASSISSFELFFPLSLESFEVDNVNICRFLSPIYLPLI